MANASKGLHRADFEEALKGAPLARLCGHQTRALSEPFHARARARGLRLSRFAEQLRVPQVRAAPRQNTGFQRVANERVLILAKRGVTAGRGSAIGLVLYPCPRAAFRLAVGLGVAHRPQAERSRLLLYVCRDLPRRDHLVAQQRLAAHWATFRTAAAQVVCVCHGLRHRDRPVDSENQPGTFLAARIVYVCRATRSNFQKNPRERLASVQHFVARILCAFLQVWQLPPRQQSTRESSPFHRLARVLCLSHAYHIPE